MWNGVNILLAGPKESGDSLEITCQEQIHIVVRQARY